ncbi:hypothetical protein [Rhodovulum sp. FJ3]|uniref:hypothetical protein n=1 Tax=Rhodovulum sp. FJ3 TaxID=3079053 RepID=UPI00293DEDFE|nr:hypothetical protein [Rhodovulum sp. FJ3]MDV4169635.1 hypothetical protein [Rhodovulum sp. FJ3]
MTPTDLETVYEALARQLDSVSADQRELFLTKLALLLAHQSGDAGAACQAIASAARDLSV